VDIVLTAGFFRETNRQVPSGTNRKVPEMKILLLVLGGAWFFLTLLFVFALAAARAKAVPPIESVKLTKSIPEAKPQRSKLRPPTHKPECEPALVRNAA
jgi:hypothetical protein